MDGLEQEFAGRLRVVRVDVQSDLGHALAREYGTFTPTFVLFGPDGEILWKEVGLIEAGKVRQSLEP